MVTEEITHRPLSVIDLDTRHCFVLSAENQIYLWIGKRNTFDKKYNIHQIV